MANKNYITSINPSTLEEIGSVEATPPEKIAEIVLNARQSQKRWGMLSFKERGSYLLRARSYLLNHIDDFAFTISEETGKPLTEALTAEIYPVADLLYYFAKNAHKLLKPERIFTGIWELMIRRSTISYQPLGVIGIISPWNYPFSIPAGTAAMALVAGNAVVLKTSSTTPFVGRRIEEMFRAAGLQEFVFNHIIGGANAGEALINARVDKLIFTGSVETGKTIMSLCAKNLTPCTLELGGKDPMIVRRDANLEHASSAAVWGAFTNSGQCCASIERVYVHEQVAEKFIELVLKKTLKLRQGVGVDHNTDIGSMTTFEQLQIVEAQVEEARRRGAKILTGGKRNPSLKGYFYLPTIITGVNHSFSCVNRETFGPIMPIMTFKDDEEAIELANDSKYGLNAYIWTRDIPFAKKMARKLKCGTVIINDCVYTHALPQTPWGGRKESGFGRTHGKAGLLELVNPVHIHVNHITFIKDMWWYPYTKSGYDAFKVLTKRLTGSLPKKLTALWKFLSLQRLNK